MASGVHSPRSAVSVAFRRGEPVTVGTARLVGAAAWTVLVAALNAVAVPSSLVAVTFRRTFASTSADTSR